MKVCSTCKIEKSLSEFRNKRLNADGKHRQCAQCMRDYDRRYRYEVNPVKYKECRDRRNAMDRLLPNTLNRRMYAVKQNAECALTGAKEDLHLDHFISVSTGHGGNYAGNIYVTTREINDNKAKKHPLIYFQWLIIEGEKNISSDKFETLLENMALLNGLTKDEFMDYVDWCYANPRTIEQARKDNEEYGYKVFSLELWRKEKGIHFPLPDFNKM